MFFFFKKKLALSSPHTTMTSLYTLPFNVLRAPQFNLKIPSIPTISPMALFAIIFAAYYVVTSGVIYDIISEPPAMGQTRNEVTGAIQIAAFLKYRLNGQYIIEGLSGGMVYITGALGVILLDLANRRKSEKTRYYLIAIGAGLVFIGYSLTVVFMKMKLPNMRF